MISQIFEMFNLSGGKQTKKKPKKNIRKKIKSKQ